MTNNNFKRKLKKNYYVKLKLLNYLKQEWIMLFLKNYSGFLHNLKI